MNFYELRGMRVVFDDACKLGELDRAIAVARQIIEATEECAEISRSTYGRMWGLRHGAVVRGMLRTADELYGDQSDMREGFIRSETRSFRRASDMWHRVEWSTSRQQSEKWKLDRGFVYPRIGSDPPSFKFEVDVAAEQDIVIDTSGNIVSVELNLWDIVA